MKIHLFNPQNDLALANGSPNFTAPSASLDLANAGACLPMWYGEAGDRFMGSVNADWFREISQAFGLEVYPTNIPIDNSVPCPWGWSPSVWRYFQKFGFGVQSLPTVNDVERWRILSSRVTNAPILRDIALALSDCMDFDPFQLKYPQIACDSETAFGFIRECDVAILKLPWSGAGRGQQITDRTTYAELVRRVNGMINRQGAIEISPYYSKKIVDFAMLWEDGKFIGYSLFSTDTTGSWTSNTLIGDEEIERVISVAQPSLRALQKTIGEILDRVAQKFDYRGPVGVDFIIALHQGRRIVVPVEINWRRTMGHVAHILRNKYLSSDCRGKFKIIPSRQCQKPFHRVKDCTVSHRCLTDGYIDLVPPGGAFRFIFSVSGITSNS